MVVGLSSFAIWQHCISYILVSDCHYGLSSIAGVASLVPSLRASHTARHMLTQRLDASRQMGEQLQRELSTMTATATRQAEAIIVLSQQVCA